MKNPTRKNRPAKTTKPTRTLSELAEILGISRQNLHGHRQRLGDAAPRLDDIVGWEEILSAAGREGSAPPELRRQISEQRLRLLTAAASREENRLTRERGEFLSKVEVNAAIDRGSARFWFRLENLVQQVWPASLVGKTSQEIHDLLTTDYKALCRQLRDDLSAITDETSTPPAAT